MSERIPVTVIGGYLGAGKTTLVNHLLRHAGGRRIAVLVNDFGALPIDADLVEAQDGSTISIAGGCVCCSFGSDLIAALRALAQRAPAPEHLLIEASGVALPGAIASSVSLLTRYACEGIFVLADAETVRARAADRYLGDTIERQLRDASVILLGKPDLVGPAERADTRRWLEGYASVVEVERGRVPAELVFGAAAGGAAGSGFARTPFVHPAYDSVSFQSLPPLDAQALAASLAAPAAGVLRAKGRLRGDDGAWTTLQVVGTRFETSPAAAGASDAGLVCIGLAGCLDRGAIERAIAGSTSSAALSR